MYIYIYICICYTTPKVYITFILTEPEGEARGEVSINVIYTERGWCNKFIS